MRAASGSQRPVLYERRPGVPDNHVDELFLTRMVLNAHTPSYSVADAASVGALVVSRMASASLVGAAMRAMLDGRLSAFGALALAIVLLVAFAALALTRAGVSPSEYALVCAVLLLASPMLHALTRAYSSDTIWALSLALMLVHVLMHDYTVPGVAASPVAFNAACFGTVLMISRLGDAWSAFAMLCLALVVFAAVPTLECSVRQRSRALHAASVACLTAGVTRLIAPASAALAAAFVLASVAVPLGGSLLLFALRGRKARISGPWDEAKIGS